MKKFIVKDEDGREYDIEQLDDDMTEVPAEETHDDEPGEAGLTSDEIAQLKQLAAAAPKLMALIEVEKEEHDVDEDLEETLDDCGTNEEIVDTDEDEEELPMKKDSTKSVGSIEIRKKSKDSCVSESIENAWAKRYGGK